MRQPHNRTLASQRPLNGFVSVSVLCAVDQPHNTTHRGSGGIVRLPPGRPKTLVPQTCSIASIGSAPRLRHNPSL